jgi:thioredoxin reductase (NADPH)
MLTTEVENFPGFPTGSWGPELMIKFREQAQRFGAEFLTEKVTGVDFTQRPFTVSVRGDRYTADAVIVSTGAQSLMLGLEAEARLLGHGLSTCATCDGFFFRGQEIAVVGGGDSAVEEATFLTKFASKVIMIHRRDSLRASKILQDRALANPKIEMMWNTVVDDLIGDDKLDGAVVRNVLTDETSTLPVTGHVRRDRSPSEHRPVQGRARHGGHGYLVTQPGSTYTNVPACSPAATCRTTRTGRRSRPRDRVHGSDRLREVARGTALSRRARPGSRQGCDGEQPAVRRGMGAQLAAVDHAQDVGGSSPVRHQADVLGVDADALQVRVQRGE